MDNAPGNWLSDGDFRRPKPESGAENADSDLETGDPHA
jgi:hypothetical protein